MKSTAIRIAQIISVPLFFGYLAFMSNEVRQLNQRLGTAINQLEAQRQDVRGLQTIIDQQGQAIVLLTDEAVKLHDLPLKVAAIDNMTVAAGNSVQVLLAIKKAEAQAASK